MPNVTGKYLYFFVQVQQMDVKQNHFGVSFADTKFIFHFENKLFLYRPQSENVFQLQTESFYSDVNIDFGLLMEIAVL